MGSSLLILLLFGGLAGVVLVVLARSMKIQQEGRVAVIETFGRFSRVAPAGRYFLWPWDRVHSQVPLQVFTFESPEQKLLTRTGSTVTLKMVVFYQLAHARRQMPLDPRLLGSPPAPRGSDLVAAAPAGPRGASPRAAVRLRTTGGMLAPQLNSISRLWGGRREFLDVEHAAYRAVYTVENWRTQTEREAVDVLHQVFTTLDVGEDMIGKANWTTRVAGMICEELNKYTIQWGVDIHEINLRDVQFSDITLQNLFSRTRAEREAEIRGIEGRSYEDLRERLRLDPDAIMRWSYIDAMREIARNPSARLILSGSPGGAAPLSTSLLGDDTPLPQVSNMPTFPPHQPELAPPLPPPGPPALPSSLRPPDE